MNAFENDLRSYPAHMPSGGARVGGSGGGGITKPSYRSITGQHGRKRDGIRRRIGPQIVLKRHSSSP